MQNKIFKWTRNGLILGALAFSINSCKDNGGGDVKLPDIDGYANSNAVAAANLQAHWTFDGTQKEDKSGAGPAQVVGASYLPGIKGQGVKLNNGYLYYTGITGLTSVTTSFTVSTWMQVDNNQTAAGGLPYQAFQYVRANPSADPNNPFGNINLTIEAGQFKHTPATGYDTLIIHPTFRDPAGGLQDNVNNYPLNLVKDTSGKWLHVLIAYNATTHLFTTWANGEKVSNFEDRGAVNVFTPSPSTNAVIGGWIANVTGIGMNVQGFTVPFVGAIDEVRVYNKALTDAEIAALYKLERVGR